MESHMDCVTQNITPRDETSKPGASLMPDDKPVLQASGTDRLQSVDALERHLENSPDDTIAHHDLATQCSRLGDRDKALRHYLESIRLNPNQSSYQKKLVAALYIETGRHDEAAALYLDILRQTPRDTEALSRLGNLSETSGQTEEAEFFYRRFLEMEPGNLSVQQRLAGLRIANSVAAACEPMGSLQGPEKPCEVREVRVQATVRLVESKYTEASVWFKLAAKDKADHIVSLCKRNGIAPEKVLEIGAGGGAILACLDQLGFAPELHALEISRSGIAVIREQKLPSVKSVTLFDGYTTPFRDQEFDLVILSHVIEHVEYERLLLREMQRISRYQVIEIPLDFHEAVDTQWLHYNSYGHINIYNPTLLRFLLATERFQVVDDIAALYSLEVTQHIQFENAGNPRTPEAVARLNENYRRTCEAKAAMSVPEQEKNASSYTVLTKRMTDAELFRAHLEFATQCHAQGQDGELMLILGSLRDHGLEDFAPLPSWAVALLKTKS
jgi:ubiquinone/menaquinone biosynthesis C-methylase UbiE